MFTRIPQVGKVQLSRRFTACLGYGGAATGSSKTPQAVTYTYDSMGRQYTVADASGTTTYSYDVYGNQTVVAAPEGTITYTYDAVTGNHLETQTAYTDTTYSYDTKGELTGVRVSTLNPDTSGLSTPLITTYTYDVMGNKASETLPATVAGTVTYDVTTSYTYDGLNDLLTVSTQDQSGNTLLSDAYTINNDGMRVGLTENLLINNSANGTAGTVVLGSVTTWTYDGMNRLTSEQVSGSYDDASGATQNIGYTTTYTYDLDGNQLSMAQNSPGSHTSTTTTYDFNANDEMTDLTTVSKQNLNGTRTTITTNTTFTYDNNGSQTNANSNVVTTYTYTGSTTTSTNTNTSTTTYTYDVRNKMVEYQDGTTTATYLYDDAGNRAQETVNGTATFYLTDTNNPTGYAQPLEQRPSAIGSPTMTYIIGDRVLGQADGSGTRTFFVVDGHGSTRLLTSSTGTITGIFNYGAYGNVTYSAGTINSIFEFGGDGVVDLASGLDFLGDGERDKQFGQANFIQSDNLSIAPGDLVNADLYVYCGGNPENADDPNGHAVYFVQRPFNASYGPLAWPLDSGHAYLLFTSTSDPGSADPFPYAIDSFSFHPDVWDYGGISSDGAPGRVWEQATEDMNSIGAYDASLITTDAGEQATLLSYIDNWIEREPVGYELGPSMADPNDPQNNTIGSLGHVDAPANGIGYSLLSQNCVWWATAMLYQSGMSLPPGLAATIASYNQSNGAGPAIVLGGRNPNESDQYQSTWFNVDQSIQGIIDWESVELTELSAFL